MIERPVMIDRWIRKIRVRHYEKGHRPKPWSIFYSPSLAIVYGWQDAIRKHKAG